MLKKEYFILSFSLGIVDHTRSGLFECTVLKQPWMKEFQVVEDCG